MTQTSTTGQAPVGVVLVEDDRHTRARLASAIRQNPGLVILGSAATLAEGKTLLFMTQAKLALIDLGLPDGSGIELIQWAQQHKPDVECVVMTSLSDDAHLIASLQAGACGYLLKSDSGLSVAQCLAEVIAGGSPLSPSIARRLLQKLHLQGSPSALAGGQTELAHKPKHAGITERELFVIQQVARGHTASEIAQQMGISGHTVATHVKRIYKKLHVHSRSEAVYEATVLGLVDL